jgi:MFS family permease
VNLHALREEVDMTVETSAASLGAAASPYYSRRWLAAVVMMVAALMDMIDGTILNVALPTIRRDLGATGTQLEWVVSAYMLAFAATLITAGSFGDLFGRKRVFLLGVAIFGAASLAAGLAQTPGELIAARLVQGAAAAAMMPQVLATFRAIFFGNERTDTNPWPVVPGLVVAGAGLALLVIPLANVVLAAVPVQAAGGASGLFTTVQQVGGAIGVAVIGSVFFGYLRGHSFLAAFTHSVPYAVAAFLLSGVLSLALPRTAVANKYAELTPTLEAEAH